MNDRLRDPDEHIQGIRAAINSVKSDVRGLPQDEAEDRLVSALRQHDAFLPIEQVRQIARHLSDPWWFVRHPVRAHRMARQPDPESTRREAEADRLSHRWREIDSVVSFNSTSTFDGMIYVVTIHPWSDEVANHIRELASPTPVTVVPRD